MAFINSSKGYWRSVMSRLRWGNSAIFPTSTSPKMNPFSSTAVDSMADQTVRRARKLRGEFVPVYVALGMIVMSASLGLLTARQQLSYSPSVRLRKRLRETLPEVVEPDRVVDEADRFIHNSVLRKVAHLQERFNPPPRDRTVPDPIRGDSFTSRPRAETLKTVGLDPKSL